MLLGLGSPLAAQQFAAGGETRLSAIPVARGEDVVIAPAVIARGLPRTIQVVEVPVPREFALSRSVSYVVDPDGLSPLLSRRTGTIGEGDKPGKVRSVLLTFSVPKRARAGLLPVARVRFLVPGMTPIEVPVQVAVEVNQSIEITIGEGLRGVRPGDRFTLSYRVMNLGNSPETVMISAVVPPGLGGRRRRQRDVGDGRQRDGGAGAHRRCAARLRDRVSFGPAHRIDPGSTRRDG